MVANTTSHLLSFEATLLRAHGLSPDAALFVTKEGYGQTSNSKRDGTKGKSRGQSSQGIAYPGCGEKGYIKPKCRNKDQWATYAAEQKSTVDANLASTEFAPAANTESFLFSIIKPNSVYEDTLITVNVATETQPADYWILDTSVIHHVTGNRHLFKSFHPMAKGQKQVKTANNKLGNGEGSGTIRFNVDRPSAKVANIVLQHVLYVPPCSTNNPRSIILLMQNGVNNEFNLDRAIASFKSTLICQAPLINSLFIHRTSPSTSTLPDLVEFDTLNHVDNTGIYSGIRQKVNKKAILVWHACLGHLSQPAIQRLSNSLNGIQLDARSPLACSCEACITRTMFQRPCQPLTSEDTSKTRLLELIHSDLLGQCRLKQCEPIAILLSSPMTTHHFLKFTS